MEIKGSCSEFYEIESIFIYKYQIEYLRFNGFQDTAEIFLAKVKLCSRMLMIKGAAELFLTKSIVSAMMTISPFTVELRAGRRVMAGLKFSDIGETGPEYSKVRESSKTF